MYSWNSIVGSMNNTKSVIGPMNSNKNKLNNGKNIRVKMRRWSYQIKKQGEDIRSDARAENKALSIEQ